MTTTEVPLPELAGRPRGLEHVAFCYHDDAQYLEVVTSFLQPALREGAPVLVAVPGHHLHLLRDRLGDAGGLVAYEDLAVTGRNPGRIIPGVLLPFAEAHPDRTVWVVGESVWPRRHPDAYSACAVHEALVNLVLAEQDIVLLCAYEARALTPDVVRDAARTHPALWRPLGSRTSRVYADPAEIATGSSPPLPAPPAHAERVDVVDERSLVPVRTAVGRHAIDVGLPSDTVAAVVLAVNELAANTVEHAGGPGRLSIWEDGHDLICQVDDTGHITDPLAGRVPPPWDAEGGRGLLLIHDLCDLVLIHTSPRGTTVRLHFTIPPSDTSEPSLPAAIAAGPRSGTSPRG